MEEYRMGKKSLELSCYVAGAGAFSVFLRWLQKQLAFNELGLADKSVLHIIIILFIAAAVAVFIRFIRRYRKDRLYLPDGFSAALTNQGTLFRLIRILAGVILCAGSILLYMKTGDDRNSSDYRVLSILGFLSGIAFPVWLGSADRDPAPKPGILCLLAFLPMLWQAAWLVICYKLNTINSVIWSYVIELAAVAVSMFAFFRLGGFVFGKPNWERCLFACMLSAVLCMMSLADERYLGQQIMFLAIALEDLICCWIMVKNLEQGEAPEKVPRKETHGGFEEL